MFQLPVTKPLSRRPDLGVVGVCPASVVFASVAPLWRGMHINELPDDIFSSIFFLLGRRMLFPRLLRLRLVCKRWREAFEATPFKGFASSGTLRLEAFHKFFPHQGFAMTQLEMIGVQVQKTHFWQRIRRVAIPQTITSLAIDGDFAGFCDFTSLPQLQRLYFVRVLLANFG